MSIDRKNQGNVRQEKTQSVSTFTDAIVQEMGKSGGQKPTTLPPHRHPLPGRRNADRRGRAGQRRTPNSGLQVSRRFAQWLSHSPAGLSVSGAAGGTSSTLAFAATGTAQTGPARVVTPSSRTVGPVQTSGAPSMNRHQATLGLPVWPDRFQSPDKENFAQSFSDSHPSHRPVVTPGSGSPIQAALANGLWA